MLVKQILLEKGRDVVTVASTATLSEAARVLASRRIGALVVHDGDGPVAGILSERDIIAALAAHSVNALGHSVSTYMTKRVSTCREGDTVEELMELMTRKRFRHVPVVEDGRLSGVVSIGDVVKSHIAETELHAESLRSYIAAG
jgi:CBS domain-containing protein